MQIIVYGLGIIGASVCAALKRAGHTVYGKNRSREPLDYALEHGMIDGVKDDYNGTDIVVLALPPRIAMRELDEGDFPDGVIVTDICGVKVPLEQTVFSKPRSYRYVGMHPMAGKETSGIGSASVTLFDGKNLVLTGCEHTDSAAFAVISQLGREMGFGRILECTAAKHDEMIALTSQLAHIVSNAYIKSPLAEDCVGYTGGSFQDMTRIAGVDEKVWTELFFLNRGYLSGEVNRLITSLQAYASVLETGSEEEMRGLLREGQTFLSRFLNKSE